MDMMSYLMGRSAGSKNAKTQVVTELPETGEPNVIYLVPKEDTEDNDIFDEYIWVNDDWELIGSTAIDISGKQDVMQFSTIPTADATTVGKIIQYVGTTTNDYTNGYFYIGTTDGTNYSWDQIDVQPGVEASNIAVCTIIGKNIGAIQVQPQNNGVVYLSSGAQTELTTFLNNHLGKYIILQLIGNNDANCIVYLGYLQTTTGSNIQIFPKYIYYWVQGSTAGVIFYGTTKVMYSYNATTNKYSIGFYENPLDGKPQPIATKKYVDDAIASAGSSVPTITVTVSQIVSQDPIQISLTAEQQAIIEDVNIGTLIVDGSALGVTPAYCQKNEDGSTDVLLAAFSFAWDVSSGFNISDTTIFAGHYDKQTHILTIVNTPLLGGTPTADNELANKKYVDDAMAAAGSGSIVFVDPATSGTSVASMNADATNIENLGKLCTALKNGEVPSVFIAKTRFSNIGALSGTQPFKYPTFYRAEYDSTNDQYSLQFYTLYPSGFQSSYIYYFDTQYCANITYLYTATYKFNGTSSEQKFTGNTEYKNDIIASTGEIQRRPISSQYFNSILDIDIYASYKTYQVGDYVAKYNTYAQTSADMCKLYRCNTADTTGTWSDAKWDEKTYLEVLQEQIVGNALGGSY